MTREHSGPSYFTIWVYLVILVVLGVSMAIMPFNKELAVGLIFTIAFVKAVLVVRHYMHLKQVPRVLYAIAGIPVILAIAMVLSLIPDIARRMHDGPPPAADTAHH
ncbi:MAG: cytochrome C oxidase subunit IV family protein [Candidatus Binatia bacterium]